jgi:hypothetical protein
MLRMTATGEFIAAMTSSVFELHESTLRLESACVCKFVTCTGTPPQTGPTKKWLLIYGDSRCHSFSFTFSHQEQEWAVTDF